MADIGARRQTTYDVPSPTAAQGRLLLCIAIPSVFAGFPFGLHTHGRLIRHANIKLFACQKWHSVAFRSIPFIPLPSEARRIPSTSEGLLIVRAQAIGALG